MGIRDRTCIRTYCWRYARTVIYKVFYKGQFDLICAVGILLVIATLVLGLVLNKSNKSNDIESIY